MLGPEMPREREIEMTKTDEARVLLEWASGAIAFLDFALVGTEPTMLKMGIIRFGRKKWEKRALRWLRETDPVELREARPPVDALDDLTARPAVDADLTMALRASRVREEELKKREGVLLAACKDALSTIETLIAEGEEDDLANTASFVMNTRIRLRGAVEEDQPSERPENTAEFVQPSRIAGYEPVSAQKRKEWLQMATEGFCQFSAHEMGSVLMDLWEAERERDRWKANHDDKVERLRVLQTRPDCPLERLPMWERLKERAEKAEQRVAEIERGES